MILIFCSWLLLFCFFTIYGTAARFLIRSQNTSLVPVILLGMALQTILLTSAAFFTAIGPLVFFINTLGALLLGIVLRKPIGRILRESTAELKSFSSYSKVILGCTLLTALFKCAQSPFILDNESYYVQTIKWLNEYGFVKGLANLNVAFGQTSGWHILQSGFNFGFLTQRLNDINGFLLLVCSAYFLSVFEQHYRKTKNFHWTIFILVFNVLNYQFLDSPSPDLPLILIAQVIFLLVLKEDKSDSEIKMVIVLFVFLAFIKITILPLGLLLISLMLQQRKNFAILLVSGLFFGILWIAKNAILTGYPLYPFRFFVVEHDWKITESMLDYITNMVRNHEFLQIENYKSFTLWQKFRIWVCFDGINGLFNKGILVLFALVPFTKAMRKPIFVVLYFALWIHFLAIFVVSPQFRFFLPEFIFLSVILIADIVNRFQFKKQLVQTGLLGMVILPVVVLFCFNPDTITQQNSVSKNAKPHLSQIAIPEPNSKYSEIEFVPIRVGNLTYFSPRQNFFFYGTANGPLPCTNQKALNLFAKKYNSLPQLRTGKIQDGFYCINPNSIK